MQYRLIFGLALLCWGMAGSTFAGKSDRSEQSPNPFAVAGVALGMDFESALKIYPSAIVERQAANCYSYGQAIRAPTLTRRVLRHRSDRGDLTLNFEPPRVGGRLSRIHYDRPVDPSGAGVRELLDRLLTLYGPHDRVLHRRKMEPAGRIVGFEWQGTDGASLRVVLRNDYANGGDNIRLSVFAKSPVPRSARRGPSQLCWKP